MPEQFQQVENAYFEAVERENYDIDTAFEEFKAKIGRSGNGIVSIGLFGGESTTADPDNITAPEEGGRDIGVVKKISKAATEVEEFTGKLRFPQTVEDAVYSSSSHSDPFGAYRITMYLGDLDNRGHTPLVEGIVEYLEQNDPGVHSIRGLEADFEEVDPKEWFRVIYPWGQREMELKERDNLDDYETPRPIRSLTSKLREHPLDCIDHKRLTLTIHYYNSQNDRDGTYDREMSLGDFYGAEDVHIIEKERRSTVQKAVDLAQVNARNESVSYELNLTIEKDELDALVEDDSHRKITTVDAAAREIAKERHQEEYGKRPTVGVVNQRQLSDMREYTLLVQS